MNHRINNPFEMPYKRDIMVRISSEIMIVALEREGFEV